MKRPRAKKEEEMCATKLESKTSMQAWPGGWDKVDKKDAVHILGISMGID